MTRRRESLPHSCLIFSQYSFEKLLWFRDHGDTEVGAMCQARPDDPLYIEDVHFLEQEVSSANTDFDVDAQHDYVVDMTEKGLSGDSYMRVWVHTHPGRSASPSGTDWETFNESMGMMPWAVMAILGKDDSNEMYCLFRYRDEAVHLPVMVDAVPNAVPDWSEQYDRCIKKKHTEKIHKPRKSGTTIQTPGKITTPGNGRTDWKEVLSFEELFNLDCPQKIGENLSRQDLSELSEFYGYTVRNQLYVPKLAFWDQDISSMLGHLSDAIAPTISSNLSTSLLQHLPVDPQSIWNFAQKLKENTTFVTPSDAAISPICTTLHLRSFNLKCSGIQELHRRIGNLPQKIQYGDYSDYLCIDQGEIKYHPNPCMEFLKDEMFSGNPSPILCTLMSCHQEKETMVLLNEVFQEVLDEFDELGLEINEDYIHDSTEAELHQKFGPTIPLKENL